MKKIPILLSLITVLTCCTDSTDDLQIADQLKSGAPTEAYYRTAEEAHNIVLSALQGGEGNCRSSCSTRIKSVKLISGNASRAGNDSLVYAVDFEDDSGFALVAAPKTVEPLLALVENGNSDSYATLTNENFQLALDMILSYVKAKSDNAQNELNGNQTVTQEPLIPVPGPAYYTDTIMPLAKTEPLIKVCWGQYWPENIYCPNKVAGCVPVAIAQMLSFYDTPLIIKYTYPGKDLALEALSWTGLKSHYKSIDNIEPDEQEINIHFDDCGGGTVIHNFLARLVRELGERCGSTYKPGMFVNDIWHRPTTSTDEPSGPAVLKEILKTNPKQGFTSSDLFKDQRILNKPALVITSKTNDQPVGHAWIADGTWQVGMIIRHHTLIYNPISDAKPGQDPYYYMTTTEGSIASYIHYNWGWSGNSNGYFLTSIFNPFYGYEYDFPGDIPSYYEFDPNIKYWIY